MKKVLCLNTAEAVDNVINLLFPMVRWQLFRLNTAEAVDNVIEILTAVSSKEVCLNTAEAVDNVIVFVGKNIPNSLVSIPPKQ